MVDVPRSNRWWVVTPRGAVAIAVLLVLLGLLTVMAIRGNNARMDTDQAAIERMVQDTNAFSEEMRCIEEKTWMLTSPEAEHAEIQVRLAAAGLPASWVDPAVLERLEAAKKCP